MNIYSCQHKTIQILVQPQYVLFWSHDNSDVCVVRHQFDSSSQLYTMPCLILRLNYQHQSCQKICFFFPPAIFLFIKNCLINAKRSDLNSMHRCVLWFSMFWSMVYQKIHFFLCSLCSLPSYWIESSFPYSIEHQGNAK